MEPFRRELRWPLATEQNAGRMQGKVLPVQTAVHLGCAYCVQGLGWILLGDLKR